MKCIQLVNENPVILRRRTDYYWVSFVFSKLFALKDKILPLNIGFKSEPKTILGIDISSSEIKLIEMESNHEGYKVVSYGVSPLPPGAVIDREIIDVEATAVISNFIEEVPVLGDIPLIGNLFKKQMRAKDKREILILITLKIIDEKFIDT